MVVVGAERHLKRALDLHRMITEEKLLARMERKEKHQKRFVFVCCGFGWWKKPTEAAVEVTEAIQE